LYRRSRLVASTPSWLTQITETSNEVVSDERSLPPGKVVWQWEHRTGFRDYDDAATARIEKGYQRGDAYTRLKSGKKGGVPMEIFFGDMIQYDPVTGNTRKVRRLGPKGIQQRVKRWVAEVLRSMETGKPRRILFEQYEQSRKSTFQNGGQGGGRDDVFGLVQNQADKLKTAGPWQMIARSRAFFGMSMMLVVLSAVWMGVDAECNDSVSLLDAEWYFQFAEHTFCALFTIELAIRFLAYAKQRDCWQDGWFVFDGILVFSQIMEIWVLAFLGQGRHLTFLRMARLMRLARLGRLMRMLRLFPEVLTLLKGIWRAMVPVFYILIMFAVLLFIFSVVFKTQSMDDEELSALFPTLSASMSLLFLRGALLDTPSAVFYTIWDASVPMAVLFVIFIFLSSFTVLNMLIGILCDVVFKVSKSEKDDASLLLLKTTMFGLLECYDKNNDKNIAIEEFDLLMSNPETSQILRRFDVDVAGLKALREVLFEYVPTEVVVPESPVAARARSASEGAASSSESSWESEIFGKEGPSPLGRSGSLEMTREMSPSESSSVGERAERADWKSQSSAFSVTTSATKDGYERKRVSFSELLEVILRLRGGNKSTVTDIMDLREYVKQRCDNMEVRLQRLDKVEIRLHDLQVGQLEMSQTLKSIEAYLGSPMSAMRSVETPTQRFRSNYSTLD